MQLTDAINSSVSHGGFALHALLSSPPLPCCLDLIDGKPLKKKRISDLRRLVKAESRSKKIFPDLTDLIRKYLLLTSSVDEERTYFLKNFVKSAYRHANADRELALSWFEKGYLHRLYSFALEGIKKASPRESPIAQCQSFPAYYPLPSLVLLSHSHGYAAYICDLLSTHSLTKEERLFWLARGYAHQGFSFDELCSALAIRREPNNGALIFPSTARDDFSLPHLLYALYRNVHASDEAYALSKAISKKLTENPSFSIGTSSRWYKRALGREAIASDLGRVIPSRMIPRNLQKLISNLETSPLLH